MSAEEIARVMRDIRQGNIGITRNGDEGLVTLNEDTQTLAQWGTVIDATPVYDRYMNDDRAKMVYEDHRICPPWDNAFLGYVNSAGNVSVMSLRTVDIQRAIEINGSMEGLVDQWESMSGTHEIDWPRVRWVMHCVLYMGGRAKGENIQTVGPLHLWRIGIYSDGEIADINWIQLLDYVDISKWDNAVMVMLETFNLVNCVNVEICEPTRSRPQAKRLARTGFTINELHIRPTSKSYRGKGTPLSAISLDPLSPVRGHFAEYGTNGKGMLFGKYTGRYWIPPHLKGNEAFGVNEHNYVVEP